MATLTMKDAAAELRVSVQWLKYWLVENPVDKDGVPFYFPTGRRWKFEAKDVERIIAHIRSLEAARLGPSVRSQVRLMGLMEKVGGATYEDLVRMRDARTKTPDRHADLLAELAISNVLGPKETRRPIKRRLRMPRAKRPGPTE